MAEKGKPAPARLFAYLAREAPIGVILRRGPTEWVEIILWHTDTDTFEFGQWFHGRIYEQVCDISPDGSIFLYFAVKWRLEKRDAPHNVDNMWKWTAMSRPPYLTALALWPIFDHMYMGGGYFLDDDSVYLFADATEQPAKGEKPDHLKVLTSESKEAERLPRRGSLNGWILVNEGVRIIPGTTYSEPRVWRKDGPAANRAILRESWDIFEHQYSYIFLDKTENQEVRIERLT